MAESDESSRQYTWNINDMPVSINVNTRDTTRMRENLSRVVRDLLPELANQPGTPLSARIGSAQAVVSIGTTDSNSSGSSQSSGSEPWSNRLHPYTADRGTRTRDGTLPAESGGNPSASFTINLGDDSNIPLGNGQDMPHNHMADPDENQNTPGHAGHGTNNGAAQTLSLRSLVKVMEGSLPFVLIALVKIMYNHRLGILVFAGLYGTFHYANKTLRKHIAQREATSLASALHLLWIIVFVNANIFLLYYVFQDQQLYNSLLFKLPAIGPIDLWALLWVVGITDFVIKFATVILKATVALLPKFIIPHKKRGKHYMLIEHLAQFYRCLVPIVPWVAFIENDDQGGQWFAYFLLVLFVIFKAQHFWSQIHDLRQGFSKFRVDVSYGSCPSRDDLCTADNCCPICQDKFNDPVKLSCKHIFCEECVSMWFDRERTCPMCRANIVDDPVWRDGSTSVSLQLF